ncbi:putative 5'-deoxynucleotidase YfbR/HDDC2 [Helianthus annuus]|nr:putative 5'-deoxynucleotidase YfbR/HDDC2 [Helianthus annuus]KAJ0674538.1 putative 5'-deoxynucleotidase YfbR/HDDC2 [Helianthus annuus]
MVLVIDFLCLEFLIYHLVIVFDYLCRCLRLMHDRVLDEFFLSTAGKFQTDIGKSWAAEVIARRNSRLAKKLN